MLYFWQGVDILLHRSQSLLHKYIPSKKHIQFWMIISINWEQSELEVNREYQTIQLFISIKQEILYVFIKTEFWEERNENKNRCSQESLKYVMGDAAHYNYRKDTCSISREGLCWVCLGRQHFVMAKQSMISTYGIRMSIWENQIN